MIYGYVSTASEQHQQHTDAEVDRLEQGGAERIFTDYEVTSTRSKRPNLDTLLGQVGEGDTVLVFSLSSVALTLPSLIRLVADLVDRGVTFHSLNDALDTSGANGSSVAGVFAALASFEQEVLHQRTGKGLSAAKARGRSGGRPHLLDAHAIEKAKHLHSAGVMSPKEVAAELGVSVPTLYRYLAR